MTVVIALHLLIIVGGSITVGANLFRKGCFLSTPTFRYGIYLVWHILWVGAIGSILRDKIIAQCFAASNSK